MSRMWELGSPETIIYKLFDALRRRLNSKLVDYLLNNAIPCTGCKILEAGSGPAFASSLLRRDERVNLSVAVDIDFEALKQGRSRDPDMCVVVADLYQLPFRNASLDVCWNSSTIEHLADPSKAIAEMRRVIRTGGRVFVGVPNLYGPLGFQRLISKSSTGIWIGRTFKGSELDRLLNLNGLKTLDRIFYFFRFFVGSIAEK